MKFINTAGNYRQYWGYVFQGRAPTEVRDAATIERCLKNRDFQLVKEADDALRQTRQEEEVAVPEPLPPPHEAPASYPDDCCPKCGRRLKRQGRHFHIRACRGKP